MYKLHEALAGKSSHETLGGTHAERSLLQESL